MTRSQYHAAAVQLLRQISTRGPVYHSACSACSETARRLCGTWGSRSAGCARGREATPEAATTGCVAESWLHGYPRRPAMGRKRSNSSGGPR